MQPRSQFALVQGFCPMGCGPTLFLGDDGGLTCRRADCPRPTAIDEILGDQEHEHVVQFDEAAFTVRHPLRERLDDQLMTCQLHKHISSQAGPPVQPGRYRARDVGGTWSWELIAKEGAR